MGTLLQNTESLLQSASNTSVSAVVDTLAIAVRTLDTLALAVGTRKMAFSLPTSGIVYGDRAAFVEDRTTLADFRCNSNGILSLNLSACVALTYLKCSDNSLTTLDISECTLLDYVDARNNNLTVAGVNKILTDLATNATAENITGGTVSLTGGTNQAPTVAGLTAKTTLENLSWTVTVTA